MFKEMLMAKMAKKKKMDPAEQEAKLGVAKELSKQAGAALGDRAKPKAKVEVAADSPDGLKSGLEKAKSMLEGSPAEEASEPASEEHSEQKAALEISPEEKELSPEQLDEKIQKLMDLKASKEKPEHNSNPFA